MIGADLAHLRALARVGSLRLQRFAGKCSGARVLGGARVGDGFGGGMDSWKAWAQRADDAVIAGAILCMTLLASPFGLAAADGRASHNASGQQGSCEFSRVQLVKLTNDRRPYVLTVRSLGRDCRSANIMTDISSASGRSAWREVLRLATFEGGDPAHASSHPSRAQVRRIVQTWASIENSGEAPAWMGHAIRPKASSTGDPTVYQTSLGRADYERIQRASKPMVCVPIGPETGHCIATVRRKIRVFMTRGV